jgi:hypothetical protein
MGGLTLPRSQQLLRDRRRSPNAHRCPRELDPICYRCSRYPPAKHSPPLSGISKRPGSGRFRASSSGFVDRNDTENLSPNGGLSLRSLGVGRFTLQDFSSRIQPFSFLGSVRKFAFRLPASLGYIASPTARAALKPVARTAFSRRPSRKLVRYLQSGCRPRRPLQSRYPAGSVQPSRPRWASLTKVL